MVSLQGNLVLDLVLDDLHCQPLVGVKALRTFHLIMVGILHLLVKWLTWALAVRNASITVDLVFIDWTIEALASPDVGLLLLSEVVLLIEVLRLEWSVEIWAEILLLLRLVI